jgi:tetratricopeptide (TPR) repeat protein
MINQFMGIKISIFLLFHFLFSTFLLAQNPQDSLYNEAKAYTELKKYSEAHIKISKHLKSYPKDAKGYFLKATIEYKTDNAWQAEKDFSQAIAIKNDYLEAYYNRAAIRIGMDKNIEAKHDLSFILYKNTSISLVWQTRGKLYLEKLNMPDSALYDFQQALTLKADLEESNSLTAKIYFDKKQFKKAENFAQTTLKKNPNNEMALQILSDIYFLEKSYTKAEPFFSERLRLNPYDYEGFLKQGILFFEQKKFEKAKNNFNKIIEKDEKNALAFEWLAKTEFALKNTKEACKYIEKAIELGNKNTIDWQNKNCK